MKKAVRGILITLIVAMLALLGLGASGCAKKNKKKPQQKQEEQTKAGEAQKKAYSEILSDLNNAISNAGKEKVDPDKVINASADITLKVGQSDKVGDFVRDSEVEYQIKTNVVIDRKNGYKNSAFYASVYNKTAGKTVGSVAYFLNKMDTVYFDIAGRKVEFKFDAGKYNNGSDSSYPAMLKELLDTEDGLKNKLVNEFGMDLDKDGIGKMLKALTSKPLIEHYKNLLSSFGPEFTLNKAINALIKDIKVYSQKSNKEVSIIEFVKEMIKGNEGVLGTIGIDASKLINSQNEIDIYEVLKNDTVRSTLNIVADKNKNQIKIEELGLIGTILKNVIGKNDSLMFRYDKKGDALSAIEFAMKLGTYKVEKKGVSKGFGFKTRIENMVAKQYKEDPTQEDIAGTFGINLSDYKQDYKVVSETTYEIEGLKLNLSKFSKSFSDEDIFNTVDSAEKITLKSEYTLDLFNESGNKTAGYFTATNANGETLLQATFNGNTFELEVTDNKVGGVPASKIFHFASKHFIRALSLVKTKDDAFRHAAQAEAEALAKAIFEKYYSTPQDAAADNDATTFDKYEKDTENADKAVKQFAFGIGSKIKANAPKKFRVKDVNVVKFFRERFIHQDDQFKNLKSERAKLRNLTFTDKKNFVDLVKKMFESIKNYTADTLELNKKSELSAYFATVGNGDRDQIVAYQLALDSKYVEAYNHLGIFTKSLEEIDKMAEGKDKDEALKKFKEEAREALKYQYEDKGYTYMNYKEKLKDHAVSKEEFKETLANYGVGRILEILKGSKGITTAKKMVIDFNESNGTLKMTLIEGGISFESNVGIKSGFTIKTTSKTECVVGTNAEAKKIDAFTPDYETDFGKYVA